MQALEAVLIGGIAKGNAIHIGLSMPPMRVDLIYFR